MKKKSNQDAYCFLVASTSLGEIALAVICDGVGGLEEGELASSTVVRRFSQWFEDELPDYLALNIDAGMVELSGLEGVWTQLLLSANEQIRAYGVDRDFALGTTFSGILFCQGRYFIGHVGDCRIYRISNGTAKVLTHDQTLIAREVERGKISEEEAREHPQRNVLLQAVGTRGSVAPEFVHGAVGPNDVFLLCCDGLYREVDERSLVESFAGLLYAEEAEIKETCRRVVQEALDNGGKDNVTVLCLSNAELAMPTRRFPDADEDAADSTIVLDGDYEAERPDDDLTTVLSDDDFTTVLSDDDSTKVLDEDDAPTTVLSGEDGERS